MREVDRIAITEEGIPSLDLMEAAGRGAFEFLEQVYPDLKQAKVLVLCGKGNNGGDGYVLARYLKQEWIETKVVSIAPLKDLTPDAATMARSYKRVDGRIILCRSLHSLRRLVESADLIVDALLGTGLKQKVRSPYKDWIDLINEYDKPVLALDIPSGLNADTAKILGTAVVAQWTATMGTVKLGLTLPPGSHYAGDVGVVDIGIPSPIIQSMKSPYRLLDHETVLDSLQARPPETHKGNAGHVLIIAGSPNKLGAALMTSKACLRMGAGLGTLALPQKAFDRIPSGFLEIMYEPMPASVDGLFASKAIHQLARLWQDKQVLAIGPGMGMSRSIKTLIREIILRCPIPMVIDADGLNALQGQLKVLKQARAPIVLTPHPGEMARLLGMTTATLQRYRLKKAMEFARRYQVTVVLKGYRSVIAVPDGKAYINPTGNPAMATAGMGDVLTGMIAGLLAQGHEWTRAITGAVYLHGYAGDRLAERMGDRGLLAGDLIDSIPFTLKEFIPARKKLHILRS